MRLPTALHMLLAVGKRGAITEPGDGEIVIPGVYQPVLEIPGPMSVAFMSGTDVRNNTYITEAERVQIGAVAGVTTLPGPFMGVGLWDIRGVLTFQFTGTTDLTKSVEFGLREDTGPTAGVWARYGLITGTFISVHFRHLLHAMSGNWTPYVITPTTVASDNLHANIAFSAYKRL